MNKGIELLKKSIGEEFHLLQKILKNGRASSLSDVLRDLAWEVSCDEIKKSMMVIALKIEQEKEILRQDLRDSISKIYGNF